MLRIFIVLLVGLSIFTNSYASLNSTDLIQINNSIQKFYQSKMPYGTFIIANGNDVIANYSDGFADKDLKIKNSLKTQFMIGSITKQFTAAALLKALYTKAALEKNQDKQIIEYVIQHLQKPISYYFNADHPLWAKKMPQWAEKISLHHLLIHSSGLPNINSAYELNTDISQNPELSGMMQYIFAQQLSFDPGTQYAYNNINYVIIAFIVEQLTSKSFPAYLAEQFFIPLGMQATSLPYGTVPLLKNRSYKYQQLARGYILPVTKSDPEISEVMDYEPMHIASGAGGMISSVEDLVKWNNALYSGVVLPKYLLELMMQPHIKCQKSSFDHYGYGLAIIHDAKLGNIYGHTGKIAGYKSRITYIASLNLSIAFATNLVPGGTEFIAAEKKIKADLADLNLGRKDFDASVYNSLAKDYPHYANNSLHYDISSYYAELMHLLESMC